MNDEIQLQGAVNMGDDEVKLGNAGASVGTFNNNAPASGIPDGTNPQNLDLDSLNTLDEPVSETIVSFSSLCQLIWIVFIERIEKRFKQNLQQIEDSYQSPWSRRRK